MLLIYFKELVAASQPFSSTVSSDRLGGGLSETLVTGEALDKYQIIAEKVVHVLVMCDGLLHLPGLFLMYYL